MCTIVLHVHAVCKSAQVLYSMLAGFPLGFLFKQWEFGSVLGFRLRTPPPESLSAVPSLALFFFFFLKPNSIQAILGGLIESYNYYRIIFSKGRSDSDSGGWIQGPCSILRTNCTSKIALI